MPENCLPRYSCFSLIALIMATPAVLSAQPPTNIVLTTSPNPVTLSQPLILTAITPASATGKITFYDGAALLGSATLIGGQAPLITTRLSPGVHVLRAHYAGDATHGPGDSSIPQTVKSLPVNTYQASVVGAYGQPVVADFNGDGKPDLAVAVTQNSTLVLLGNGDGTFHVGNTVLGSVVAIGDFNGDGFDDLVVSAPVVSDNGTLLAYTVTLLLGRFDGSFGPPVIIDHVTAPTSPLAGAIADLNGDGKADLIITGAAVYHVLLGNGNGTFQTPLSSVVTEFGGPPFARVPLVADFNGDGKPDLALAGISDIYVLTGNGDGTFQMLSTISPGSMAIVLADFNGDGKPDLAFVGTPTGVGITVMLGNGDGTFQTVSNHVADNLGAGVTLHPSLVVGDFNGDGKPDVGIIHRPNNFNPNPGFSFWYGNGDGTFQLPPTELCAVAATPCLTQSQSYDSFAVADFNGDGRVDLAFANQNGALSVLLGSAVPDLTIAITHTGSFSPGSSGQIYTLTVSALPFGTSSALVTVTDTLPPGLTATAISAGGNWRCTLATLTCSNPDSLAPGASFPPITITVNVAANVPGVIANTAAVSGGGDTTPANNTAVDRIILRTGTTTLASSPNPAILGQPVSLMATLSSGSTGSVTFFDGTSALGTSPVQGGQASLITRLLGEGIHSLRASFNPDLTSQYASSKSVSVSQVVTQALANSFLPPVNYTVPLGLYIAQGDFNGDGKTDLVVLGGSAGSVMTVLLGNGDGTFQPPVITQVNYPGPPTVADLNGDGKADLVLPGITVLLSNGDGTFRQAGSYSNGFAAPLIADFNGDGKPDVAVFSGSYLSMLLGNGDGTFTGPTNYLLNSGAGGDSGYLAADLNGDGKADLVYDTLGRIVVLLGNGDGTFQPEWTLPYGGGTNLDTLAIGDFNGDGKPDIALNYFNYSQVTVFFGKGDGTFQPAGPSYPGTLAAAGDLNGDGKSDLVVFIGPNILRILLSNGDGTFQAPILVPTGGGPGRAVVGEFNGDGRADIAVANGQSLSIAVLLGAFSQNTLRTPLTVWRPANGSWYLDMPAGSPVTQQWGLSGDIPVAGDFDHDGILDFAVWRPSNGTWYVVPSTQPTVPVTRQWGLPGDIPVAGDFDGDGKADYAVWRPSNGTWYIVPSSNPANPITKQWGLPGDIPVVADFDGDGKADFAVWRPSIGTWFITLSTSGATVIKQWGLSGDIPVAADFDGDGQADFAVWRPSTGVWYIVPTSNPGTPIINQWGLNGDIPVPRDYDGDGKTDFAVWRPSNGTWFIIPSSAPASSIVMQWGLTNDVPLYRPVGF